MDVAGNAKSPVMKSFACCSRRTSGSRSYERTIRARAAGLPGVAGYRRVSRSAASLCAEWRRLVRQSARVVAVDDRRCTALVVRPRVLRRRARYARAMVTAGGHRDDGAIPGFAQPDVRRRAPDFVGL